MLVSILFNILTLKNNFHILPQLILSVLSLHLMLLTIQCMRLYLVYQTLNILFSQCSDLVLHDKTQSPFYLILHTNFKPALDFSFRAQRDELSPLRHSYYPSHINQACPKFSEEVPKTSRGNANSFWSFPKIKKEKNTYTAHIDSEQNIDTENWMLSIILSSHCFSRVKYTLF